MNDIYKLLKNKNFLLLWGSAVLSQITINMLSFLILTRVFEKTNSSIATSFVWVAYALGAVLFGPFGAVTADISTRKKILQFATLSQAFTVLLYSFLYQRFFYLGYGIVFLYSAFNQFYVPSEAATLPSIVKKENLPAANGILFITVQTALLLGLVSAGILYETIGFGTALFITSLFLLIAFGLVSMLPKIKPIEKAPSNLESRIQLMVKDLGEGYRFIRNSKTILYPFLLLIGLQVSLSVLVILIPVMAQQILQIKASAASLIVVLPAGAGALIGTFAINKLISKHMRKIDIVTVALTALSVCIFIFADLVPLFPFWIGRTVAVACFFVAGFAYVNSSIPTLTYLQEKTPGGLMGRVLGNIWFISAIATVLPVLFAATVAELFGVGSTLTLLSVMGFIAVFIFRNHTKVAKIYSIFLQNKK